MGCLWLSHERLLLRLAYICRSSEGPGNPLILEAWLNSLYLLRWHNHWLHKLVRMPNFKRELSRLLLTCKDHLIVWLFSHFSWLWDDKLLWLQSRLLKSLSDSVHDWRLVSHMARKWIYIGFRRDSGILRVAHQRRWLLLHGIILLWRNLTF